MTDFPAAHSMDTTWFAIDSDGHVAVFESGESGCVPQDAYLGEDYGEITDQVHDLPSTSAVYDLAGWCAAAGPSHVHAPSLPFIPEVIAFVHDLAPLRALLARLEAEEFPATSGAALRFRSADPTAFEELHARGACLSCFYFGDERGELAAHGVYRYEHTCDNWIAGPYARKVIPAAPIHAEALPALTKAVRYPGRFADKPELQPAELWHCETWEPSWLASDRKTVHPFAGRESDYAESIESLREFDPALVLPEAPSAKPTAPPGEPATATRKPWWKFW